MNTNYITESQERRSAYVAPITKWEKIETISMITASKPDPGDPIDKKMSATNENQGSVNNDQAFTISWED